MKKVLIFDHSFFLSKVFKTILEEKFSIKDANVAHTKSELHEYVSVIIYDLIILDIDAKGMEDLALINVIKSKSPHTKVLVFSYFKDNTYIKNSIKYGADFFLNKDCTEEKLNQVLNLLLYSGEYFLNDVNLIKTLTLSTSDLSEKGKILNKLSKREFQVAQMLIKGVSNVEISKQLNLSMSTISTFKKRILLKTNTENLLELSRYFSDDLLD